MAEHWVCKPDGAIQCQEIAGTSLEEMRKYLDLLVGSENILAQEKKQVIVPTVCGFPTGSRNAYLLTELGYEILLHGVRGREGFADCPAGPVPGLSGGSDKPLNFGELLEVGAVTSAATIPVLIRDLIGTLVRVYEQGSPITQDFRPERTNIVTKDQDIADIWFG